MVHMPATRFIRQMWATACGKFVILVLFITLYFYLAHVTCLILISNGQDACKENGASKDYNNCGPPTVRWKEINAIIQMLNMEYG